MENIVCPVTEVEDVQRQSIRIIALVLERQSLDGAFRTGLSIQMDKFPSERFSVLIEEFGDSPDRARTGSELDLYFLTVLHRAVGARAYQLKEILHIGIQSHVTVADDKDLHLGLGGYLLPISSFDARGRDEGVKSWSRDGYLLGGAGLGLSASHDFIIAVFQLVLDAHGYRLSLVISGGKRHLCHILRQKLALSVFVFSKGDVSHRGIHKSHFDVEGIQDKDPPGELAGLTGGIHDLDCDPVPVPVFD